MEHYSFSRGLSRKQCTYVFYSQFFLTTPKILHKTENIIFFISIATLFFCPHRITHATANFIKLDVQFAPLWHFFTHEVHDSQKMSSSRLRQSNLSFVERLKLWSIHGARTDFRTAEQRANTRDGKLSACCKRVTETTTNKQALSKRHYMDRLRDLASPNI